MNIWQDRQHAGFTRYEAFVGAVWLVIILMAGPLVMYAAPKVRLTAYVNDETQKIDVIRQYAFEPDGRAKLCSKEISKIGSADLSVSIWNKPMSLECGDNNIRLIYNVYEPICSLFVSALRKRGAYISVQGAPLEDPASQCRSATNVWVDL